MIGEPLEVGAEIMDLGRRKIDARHPPPAGGKEFAQNLGGSIHCANLGLDLPDPTAGDAVAFPFGE